MRLECKPTSGSDELLLRHHGGDLAFAALTGCASAIFVIQRDLEGGFWSKLLAGGFGVEGGGRAAFGGGVEEDVIFFVEVVGEHCSSLLRGVAGDRGRGEKSTVCDRVVVVSSV